MFLKELFWCDGIRDKFRALSSGSSGSMLNISQDAMLRTVVPIPPYPIQMKFEGLSWGMLKIQSEARSAAAKIDATWETLLRRAFSGQLTMKWRDSHIDELLAEIHEQTRRLNSPVSKELEAAT